MKKYIIGTILTILIVLLMSPLIINFWMINKYTNRIYTNTSDTYDIALVLGCSVKKDGSPSLMLKDRLDKAIELYNNNIVEYILVSGYHHEDYNEIDGMKKYLLDNDIREDAILLDYDGHNTRSSIKNYIDNYKDKSAIIISQKYHLYRALFLLDRYNGKGIGIMAKDVNYVGQTLRDIREILARNKDFLIQ